MAIFEIFQLNWITLLVSGARPLFDRLERIRIRIHPKMFDFRRLFWGELLHYTQWLLFHNLLGIHDWFTLRHFVRKLTSSKMDKKRCKRGCVAKWFTTILLVNRTRNAAPSQCVHPPSQLSSQLTAIKCRNDLFKIGKSFTIWRLLLPLLS